MTKTLEDVKADMSALYESVKAGGTDLKTAGELTNITGKFLKADALQFAKQVFIANNPDAQAAIPNLSGENG